MANYIQTNLRYEKMQENGKARKVTETYLVDALTFTEAEARIIEEMTPFISGDFSVSAVKKTKITEVFTDGECDKYYLAKVAFITLDEKSGTEKRTVSNMVVNANDFHSALRILEYGMKDTVSEYEIVSIAESPVLEVYPVKSVRLEQ